LHTLRTRQKLPLYLFISLAILFSFVSYIEYEKIQEKIVYENTHKYMHFTTHLSALIHKLQEERGLSAAYISKKGDIFIEKLNAHRLQSDASIKILHGHIQSFSAASCHIEVQHNLKQLEIDLSKLKGIRGEVDSFKNDGVYYYTQVINRLITLIEHIVFISKDDKLVNLTQSYLIIIKMQEKAGLERRLISKILGEGTISHEQLYSLGKLIATQKAYAEFFLTIALKKHKILFQEGQASEDAQKVEDIRNVIYSKSKRNELLSSMKASIGYGGLIHNFKNYVLRGKVRYEQRALQDYKKLYSLVLEYQALDGTTKDEMHELKIIQSTFLEYIKNLNHVSKGYTHNSDVHAIDKIVKVDDGPALKALDNLTQHIYGSVAQWFEVSTHRIDDLHKLEADISRDILEFIDVHSSALNIHIVMNILAMLVIGIIIVVTFIVLRELLASRKMLKRAQENTRSGSYEYYFDNDSLFCSNEFFKLLEIDNIDVEFTMQEFKKYIHRGDAIEFDYSVKEAIRSNSITYAEYRVVLKNKKVLFVRSSFEVIKYSRDGVAQVIVGTMTDISESKRLEDEIVETQKDVILHMGAIGETRSKETGAHVKRVAGYSELLAILAGESQEQASLLKMASPMHDIGKVGIPDSILKKPGKLTADEWKVMKTHAELGYEMLKYSKRPILQLAASVAYTHHEHYNGKGYPRGLKGEEIPLEGRITALVDVFDALGSDRCYKKAWPMDEVLEYIEKEKGRMFDPDIVELFFKHLEEFLAIKDFYQDDDF